MFGFDSFSSSISTQWRTCKLNPVELIHLHQLNTQTAIIEQSLVNGHNDSLYQQLGSEATALIAIDLETLATATPY